MQQNYSWRENLTFKFPKPIYSKCSTASEMIDRMNLISSLAIIMELSMDLKYTEKPDSYISEISQQLFCYRDKVKELICWEGESGRNPSIEFADGALPWVYAIARKMYYDCNEESFRSKDSIPVECPCA